jgi:hypothetical protein
VPIDDDLLRVLDSEAGTSVRYRVPPTPLTGGFWAAIYSFELDNAPDAWRGDLVLRVMPDPDVAAKETIVQRELADWGYPLRPFLRRDTTSTRRRRQIMPARGRPPLGDLHFGRALVGLPRTLRHLPDVLATTAQRLHAIEPTAIRRALTDAGIDGRRLGAHPYLNKIRRAAQTGSGGFNEFDEWFQSHDIPSRDDVVCHGDLHPLNLLVTADATYSAVWNRSRRSSALVESR